MRAETSSVSIIAVPQSLEITSISGPVFSDYYPLVPVLGVRPIKISKEYFLLEKMRTRYKQLQ